MPSEPIQAADPLLQQMPASMPRMGMAVVDYLRLREETEALPNRRQRPSRPSRNKAGAGDDRRRYGKGVRRERCCAA